MANRYWLPIMWGGLNVLCLLSVVTPLGLITANLIMLPLLVLYMRLPQKVFMVTYVVSLLVLWLLGGGVGLGLTLVSMFFLPPAIVMGALQKRKAAARVAVISAIFTLLGEQILLLLIAYGAGLDPIGRYRGFLQGIADQLKKSTAGMGMIKPEAIDAAVPLMVQMIPLFMISLSVFYVIVTHGIGRWALGRAGVRLSALEPIRYWKLPKTFIWYYLIGLVLEFFVDVESDSALLTVTVNLMPLLTLAMIVQAISFLFYVVHVKRWSKLLPLGAIVLLVLIQYPTIYLFTLLGLIDIAFPLRERIKSNQR